MSAPRSVLFICTGNSARSLMAEALLAHHGRGRFTAHSAGARPSGEVNPLTLRTLTIAGLPTADLSSKSWEPFYAPGAPEMEFIFTLCDAAAAEPCPSWPGHPLTAHWGVADPAPATGSDAERLAVFSDVFRQIQRRVELFCALPLDALDRLATHHAVKGLGRS